MNTCLVTIHTGGTYWDDVAGMTHPYMKRYADKIGVNFEVIRSVDPKRTHVCWGKLDLFDQLPKYDRLLYIDTDVLIRPSSPNIFDITPEGNCALYNENHLGKPLREMAFTECRDKYNEYWKSQGKKELNIEYNNTDYNAGIFIVDRTCNFLIDPGKELKVRWIEQTYFNLIIQANKLPVVNLPYGYNAMGPEKNSLAGILYFLHFAGLSSNDRLRTIKRYMSSPKF